MVAGPVKTPCVGICSTTYGDQVCRGCRRFAHEIIDWNRYDDDQKRAVRARLIALRDQVVSGRIRVVDPARLTARLRHHRIPFAEDDTDASRAWLLLWRGARHIRRLEAYGLRVCDDWAHLSPVELRERIDRDFQTLSEAHYERYINPDVPVPREEKGT